MTEAPAAIRILLADDHAIVLSGLRAVLEDEPDIDIVAAASTPQQALHQARALRPDVAILDVRFGREGDTSGIDTCRQMRSELPGTQVIMFTSYSERESVLASILAGATAFLTKNVGPAQLIEAIRAVHRGESLLDSTVTRNVIERLGELSRSSSPSGGLTETERKVLQMVARGLTNRQIAEELIVSPYTARNHVIHILNKLGLSRRAEAAAQAVRLGLTGP